MLPNVLPSGGVYIYKPYYLGDFKFLSSKVLKIIFNFILIMLMKNV